MFPPPFHPSSYYFYSFIHYYYSCYYYYYSDLQGIPVDPKIQQLSLTGDAF
jgi:hypothetical protein